MAHHAHAPSTPSRLQQTHLPGTSPESIGEARLDSVLSFEGDGIHFSNEPSSSALDTEDDPPSSTTATQQPYADEEDVPPEAEISNSQINGNGDLRQRILENYPRDNDNKFSPTNTEPPSRGEGQPLLPHHLGNIRSPTHLEAEEPGPSLLRRVLGTAIADGFLGIGHGKGRDNLKRMSTTEWLAARHGVKHSRRMFVNYYIPCTRWIKQYQWSFIKGDLIAAITMASFYIPMALSYADNLGHVPPVQGLYAFVFNPIVYAILGTCPQMVVGPEAAGSLLVGNVVRSSISKGHSVDENDVLNARIAGVVTGMAGGIIFLAGLARLGFLESVLSKPFLRGFISAIGFVILVDQLIPEMGLNELAKQMGASHGSSVSKLIFLVENITKAHKLTCYVSFGAFAIIMICRWLKTRFQPHFPSVAYIPDRFTVVLLSAVLAWKFEWDKHGVEVLGNVKPAAGRIFEFRWPIIPSSMHHVQEAMSTSFIIALLGFFESTVAGKSISDAANKSNRGEKGIQGIYMSANRELVALGVANVVGGCFMALPAFGGYGRSKVNASTGGKTPMSSVFLALITVICIVALLPYFYYLPKGVLSAMVSVVAWSLIEECPHDINFFVKIRGWSELALMLTIFLATVFYSLPLGIALGMGFSILAVIKHATQPRIQILGKVPESNRFENAEDAPFELEFFSGCLIIKIPEPLTFANTGDLKSRLRRLELYGTNDAHPALPRTRMEKNNHNIIFDVHGVTSLDGSGAQVLAEVVQDYIDKGAKVFFCRCPRKGSGVWIRFEKAGIVDMCGGESHFVKDVYEAIKLAERGDADVYRDQVRNHGPQSSS